MVWRGGGGGGLPGTGSLGFLRVGSESEEHADHQAQNQHVELKTQRIPAVKSDGDSCRDR